MGYAIPKSQALREALEKPKLATHKLLLSLNEAADLLNVSKWTIYRLLDDQKLSSLKVRSRRLIPRQAVEQYIAKQQAEGAA